jgi:hypothetical protein
MLYLGFHNNKIDNDLNLTTIYIHHIFFTRKVRACMIVKLISV